MMFLSLFVFHPASRIQDSVSVSTSQERKSAMKSLGAERIRIKMGDVWESPLLHVLLTEEDNVIVARCLDFTVSSHGKDRQEALASLADSIKEYVLTALDVDAVNTISDPAHGKYWRMFNELETRQVKSKLRSSLKKSVGSVPRKHIEQSGVEISHA